MKEYTQETNSLRLLVRYDQFKEFDFIQTAFNVLQSKDRQKSKYIIKAIEHYEKYASACKDEIDFLFALRCMRFLKSYYNLKSKNAIKNLLQDGTSSSAFQIAEERKLGTETPRPSLLGFNKSDDKETKMHDRLFQMDPVDRVSLICSAIERYVKDGMDSSALMALSYTFMYDTFIEYEKCDNKSKLVDNLYQLCQMCEDYEDLYEDEEYLELFKN